MKITREFLQNLNFKVMSEFDKQGFAGVQSPVPMIAETEQYLIVLDGNYCEIYDENGELTDSCSDVCELPYTL